MAKIFKFDLDKVERKNWASPQDADVWFAANQDLLLWMANESQDGKKLLRLEQSDLERVDEIAMNRVTQHEYVREGLWRPKYRRVSTTDFRVGAKWANLINYQWDWFSELAREYYAKATEKRLVHSGLWNPVVAWKGMAYGSTLTVYPDADPETTTVDGDVGYVVALTAGDIWANIIAKTDGNQVSDNAANGTVFNFRGDSTTDVWRALQRAFYLFDTSALTASATISAATLSLFGRGKADNLSVTPSVNVYSSTPASNTSLANGDFDQVGSTAFATAIAYADWSTVAYNDFALNASGISNISKTGVSKFSGRNANYDVAAVAPTWSNDAFSNITDYKAEQADVTNDPKLVVTYTVPVGPASVKTYNGVAAASVKTINDVAIASVKTWNGIA